MGSTGERVKGKMADLSTCVPVCVPPVCVRTRTGRRTGRPTQADTQAGLKAFFEPASVAVIGASTDPTKLGHAVLRNLVEACAEPGRSVRVEHRPEPVEGLSGMEELAHTIAAFLSYEKRVQEAAEWPYAPGMLQELTISTLAPVGAWLLDVFSDLLFFG